MNVKLRKIEVDAATATALETRAAELGLSGAVIVGLESASEDVVRWLDTWETPQCRACDARRQ